MQKLPECRAERLFDIEMDAAMNRDASAPKLTGYNHSKLLQLAYSVTGCREGHWIPGRARELAF